MSDAEKFLRLCFDFVSHPLWFPFACLASMPIILYVALGQDGKREEMMISGRQVSHTSEPEPRCDCCHQRVEKSAVYDCRASSDGLLVVPYDVHEGSAINEQDCEAQSEPTGLTLATLDEKPFLGKVPLRILMLVYYGIFVYDLIQFRSFGKSLSDAVLILNDNLYLLGNLKFISQIDKI